MALTVTATQTIMQAYASVPATMADAESRRLADCNSPISSLHPARQQPLDPTLSPPCRNHERRADWPGRQADRPHPWGATSATGEDDVAAVRVKGRRSSENKES